MRKPLAVGAATIAVALSLGLAACGSDDSDEGLTKAEVIEQADAVCLDYTGQLAEIVSNLDPQATQADAEACKYSIRKRDRDRAATAMICRDGMTT